MVRAFYPLAVGAALLVLAPLSIAQNIPEPYEGCASDPDWCDPVAANDGRVKTGDEPVRVILYAHFQELLQHAPMNTQPPDPVYETDVNGSFRMPTLYVDDVAGQSPPCCRLDNNKFQMVNVPMLIEYLAEDEWRVWSEPGLGSDLTFVGETMTAFFYVSPGGAETDQTPGVVPAVGAHVAMHSGRFAFMEGSKVVAVGDTGTGAGQPSAEGAGSSLSIVSSPGDDPVYELRVPMQIQMRSLPSVYNLTAPRDLSGYNAEVAVYQLETGPAEFTQNEWRVRSGHLWPPRIVVDVQRPLQAGDISLTDHGAGSVSAAWQVSGAFGAYDIHPETFRMSVRGPTIVHPAMTSGLNQWNIEHNSLLRPTTAKWVISADPPLADGTYDIDASVMNRQGTYRAEANTSFEVVGGQIQLGERTPLDGYAVIPGPGAAGLLAAAAAAVVVAGLTTRERLGRD